MNYLEELLKIRNYTFDSIIELNRRFLPQRYYSYPWTYPGLDHGRAVLTTGIRPKSMKYLIKLALILSEAQTFK